MSFIAHGGLLPAVLLLLAANYLFQLATCLDSTNASSTNSSSTSSSSAPSTLTTPVTTPPPIPSFSVPWYCNPEGPLNQTGTESETIVFVSQGTHTTTFIEACSAWASEFQSSEAVAYSSWTEWLATRQLTTSTLNTTYPSFIRPSENTQLCDIYGPLCQTGSITVAVNFTGSITSTVVACSEYLSAQSSSLNPSGAPPGQFSTTDFAWYTSFGRSPECHSYVFEGDALSFTNCGASQSLGLATDYLPVGFLTNQEDENIFNCCGTCEFYADEVKLLFFPPSDSPCSNAADGSLAPRAPGQLPGSTAIYSGHTLTSPSVYIEVIGPATVMDSCGVVSPIVTNLLVGLDASDISTIHYNEPLGATYFPLPNQWDSSVTQLNIQDLACPTFGLGNATTVFSTQTVDGYTDTWSDIYTTFGPPYKPIIIVPPVLLSYRSEWISTCGNYSYTPVSWIQTFGIVDPPQPLTPQAVLSVPQTTPAAATTVDPQPPVTGADPGTKPTMFSPSTQPQLAPTPSPQGGSGSNGGGGQNGGGSNDKGNPAVGGQNPGSGSAPNNGNPAPVLDPGVGGIIASMFGIGSPTNRNPSNPLGSGSQGSQGDPGDPGSSGSDDGSFNDNSSGGSPPADSDPPGSPPITSALAYPGNGEPVEIDLGGHIFTIPAASEIILGPGTTLTAAGPAATLLGSVYSVNAAGYVIVSATGDDIGSPTTPQESLSTITFAGQVLTVGPNDVIVDGTTLFPHSIITVSGTVIYLGGDGMLDVGLSSTSLFPNSFATLATTTPEVVTLDGEIFTLEPSGLVVVDGTTLTVGQGATISGKPISVESGGAIVVGSQTATESAGTPPSKTGAATASSSTSGALKLGGGWTVLLTMVAVSIIGLELTTS